MLATGKVDKAALRELLAARASGREEDRVTKAIDCLVNVDFGDQKQPEWMVRVKEDYFKGGDSFFKSPELPELLEDMDANGVERAILHDHASTASDDRAQRFAAARARPLRARRRRVQPAAADEGAARARVVRRATTRWPTPSSGPSFWGDGMYPPSDAVYYPLYTKCCELDLPLCLNTGIPGPPIPGEVQNPIHLDRVCVRFPELRCA